MNSGHSNRGVVDGLAHDLRNVLQTIAQAAELITCDESQAGLVDIIRRSVEQGHRMLNSAESSKPAPLRDLISSAAQFVTDYVAVHGGAMPALISKVDPDILAARPDDLERALINLFLNSAQAARRSGLAQVSLVVVARQELGHIFLGVGDDGPGLPEPLRERIFSSPDGEPVEGMG